MPHPPRPVRGREPLPEEVQLPVEPPSQVRGHRLEGVVVQVDVVDDRGREEAPVGGDSQQEGLQPTRLNLEVENLSSFSNYDCFKWNFLCDISTLRGWGLAQKIHKFSFEH